MEPALHQSVLYQLNAALQSLLSSSAPTGLSREIGSIRLHVESYTGLGAGLDQNDREWEKYWKQKLFVEVRKELSANQVVEADQVLSVSHTSTKTERAVLVVGSNRPIGVDLEHESREVSPRVLDRISNLQERALVQAQASFPNLDSSMGLTLWVAKEAGFKSNPQNLGTTIPNYRLCSWQSDANRGGQGELLFPQSVMGEAVSQHKCRFKVIVVNHWCVAFAVK